jgi:hypothetical protein
MYIFHQKVKHIKQKLEIWNKEEFGNIFQGKKEIASQMEQVQQAIIHEGRIEQLIRKIRKYNLKLMKEKNKRNCSGKRNLEYVCSKRGKKHKIIPQIYHSMKASQSHHLFKI